MDKIILVGVRLYNEDNSLSKKAYDFKNSCEFKIKKGDKVVVKVGTGGTTEGIVEYIEEKVKETGIKYKNIVEVIGLNVNQEELIEGNSYICDIRIWRNQWSAEGGYREQWSDLTIKCLYDPNNKIKIGDIVAYEGEKAKVVNLRQIQASKTKNLKSITIKDKKIESTNILNDNNVEYKKINIDKNRIEKKNTKRMQEDKTIYTKHIKLMFAAGICALISFVFIPFLLVTIALLLSALICMIKNWKRINYEYKIRKNK